MAKPNHPRDAEHIDLDDENDHPWKHKISGKELAEVFAESPFYVRNIKNRTGKWRMIGRTRAGRAIVCAILYDPIRRAVIPITARVCEPEEVKKWQI